MKTVTLFNRALNHKPASNLILNKENTAILLYHSFFISIQNNNTGISHV